MRVAVFIVASLLLVGCGHDNGPQFVETPAHGVKDPVCGMIVDPKTSPRSDYQGKKYYFCSREDKERFDKAPAQYLPR